MAGTFPQHSLPVENDLPSLIAIGELVKATENCRWEELDQIAPTVPDLGKRIQLTSMEQAILRYLPYLEEACARPKAYLKTDTARVYVSQARRIPARATSYLAAHTEDWERPTLRSVRPKRVLAEVREDDLDIYENRIPDVIFAKFVEACLSPSHETLSAQISALIEFARADAGGGDVADIVWDLATTARKDYEEVRAEGRESAFSDYLPIPDDNKYQKRVWVLPNLSAFTNIYARINLYEKGRLANVRLIHDEQLQFDEILKISKRAAEGIRDSATEMFTPHSDYEFKE
jgi:hypothetical protein